jgi:exopolysaccharide biosynthesis polyprenyl glycosylphosphotransferase
MHAELVTGYRAGSSVITEGIGSASPNGAAVPAVLESDSDEISPQDALSHAVERDSLYRRSNAITGRAVARDSVYRRSLATADGLAVIVTLLVATRLVGGNHQVARIVEAILAVALMVIIVKVIGLYDRQESLIRKSTLDEAPVLFQLATLYALIFWLINGELVSGHTDRRVLLFLWISLFPNLLLFRAAARGIARLVTPAERSLVIGDRSTCERIRAKLTTRNALHADVVACIPLDSVGDREAAHLPSHSADVRALVAHYEVERIIIAPERSDLEDVMNLTCAASAVGVKVSVVPRILEVIGSAVEFEDIEAIPLLTMRHVQLSWSSQLIKRALDVVVSLVGLLLLAPVWAVIAVAIKLDSPGPTLFRQSRVGREGKLFEMLKFRTMVDGAHEQRDQLRHLNEAQGLFKIASDPRITRVGGLLRRLSLDEIPQLWNVVCGDMSLVGPRPLVAEEDCHIRGWHRRRLQLTPGMTGHWQILGSARIPLDEMAKIDYLYVTNWSLWNDLKILLRTIPYVAARQGM